MANLTKVLIVLNSSKADAVSLITELQDYFKLNNINYTVHNDDEHLEDDLDLAIVLGGDGTVLSASHLIKERNIPVMAFNLGNLGFIADFNPNYWKEALDHFRKDELGCSPRRLLEINVLRHGRCCSQTVALNDAVISSYGHQKLININLAINNENLGSVRSDAIIVASPTGSTAYALSSGGPVIPPDLDAMVVVAVSPFSLAMRPLVLADDAVISLTVNRHQRCNLALNIDGEEAIRLEEEDEIIVTTTSYSLKLLTPKNYSFYQVLKQKLGWKGQP